MEKKFKLIGQWIQELRKEKGWTQAYLASRLGIVGSHLADLERGHKKPTKVMFYALRTIFGRSKFDILSEESVFYKKGREFLKE